ncbi:GAF domain-containing protein [Arthrobacter sp. SD76]|uniref:GAF domain-containing protein n=1 Tax=Arthrobacter sp. SD76 TaxID=3415007 RepID=UPI003C70696A
MTLEQWLNSIARLTAAVNANQQLPDVLHQVAATARNLLGYDYCAVLLPDEQGEHLVIMGYSGLTKNYVDRINSERPLPLTGAPAQDVPSSRAFLSGKVHAMTDIADAPGFEGNWAHLQKTRSSGQWCLCRWSPPAK